jgi:hypothetical protein
MSTPKIQINEAINYDKYKEVLAPDLFNFLCSVDPTTDKKYSQWIIRCFFKDFRIITTLLPMIAKNDDYVHHDKLSFHPLNLEGVNLLASKYDSILKRWLKEDHPKVTEALKKYTKLKNKKLLGDEREYNIMNITNFASLDDLIDNKYASELEEVEANEPLNPDEYEKWYEDNKWLVVIPLDHRAACKYGANTKWCTTYKDDDTYFKQYSEEGPLIIIINKYSELEPGETHQSKVASIKSKKNKKWQIHLESDQWMDATDHDVGDHQDFVTDLPKDVSTAIYEHTKSFMFSPNKVQTLTDICNDPDKLKNLVSECYGKNIWYALRDKDISYFTDIFPVDFITMAIQDLFFEDRMDNFIDSYSYGYDNPDEVLTGQEPANPDNAKCPVCQGTKFVLATSVEEDAENPTGWSYSIDPDTYFKWVKNVKENKPEWYDQFLTLYNKSDDGWYDPIDVSAMLKFSAQAKSKCKACSGSGIANFDSDDPEFWSEDQRIEAGSEAESAAMDDAAKETTRDMNVISNDYREYYDKVQDKILKDYISMVNYPTKTVETMLNLVLLYNISP